MTTRNQVLSLAASQVGYRERGNNITKYWAELKPSYQGGAWCAAFVVWCLKHSGTTLMLSGPRHPYYTPSMEAWARKTGRWVNSRNALPGDVLIFGTRKATHTGFLVSQDGNYVRTIEGNTSSGSRGSQTNGGGVYRRRRPRSWVRGAISLKTEYSSMTSSGSRTFRSTVVTKDTKEITVDGQLGPQTYSAWEKYQNLPINGVWDRMDVRSLQSWVSRNRTGKLSREDVKSIQRKLGVNADGVWGRQTTIALQQFLNRRFAESK